MKYLNSKHRRRPKKKLINRQVFKSDPKEYGKNHLKAVNNPEGFYHL